MQNLQLSLMSGFVSTSSTTSLSAEMIPNCARFSVFVYRIGLEGPKPAIDLESEEIVSQLLELFAASIQYPARNRIPSRQQQKVLNALNKSVAAATELEQSLAVFSFQFSHSF